MSDQPASASPDPTGPDPTGPDPTGPDPTSPDPTDARPTGPAPSRPAGVHLDLDALADARVGELADDAHLRDCASCRARLDELAAADAELDTAFAGLAPPPLPGPVAARWQEALRSEPRPSAGRVVALRRPRRSWPMSVAASLVLLLAGGWGWTVLRDAGVPGAESATTAASGGSTADSADSGAADRRDEDTAAAAPEQDDAAVAAGPPELGDPATTSAAAVPQAATGVDYADPAQRAAATAQVLAAAAPEAPAAAPPLGSSSSPAVGLGRLRDPDALAACLSVLDGPALAIDFARFGDRPALAVLLPQSGDPDAVSVLVVGPGCSADEPQVLLTASVPRPG